MSWHLLTRRIAWVDTDASGRIHFTAAFRLAEVGETCLLRALGIAADDAIDYPRRHVEAEYLSPLRFDDEVDVAIRVAHVGTTSVRFEWELRLRGTCAVRGRHTVVKVDSAGRAHPVDERSRDLLVRAIDT